MGLLEKMGNFIAPPEEDEELELTESEAQALSKYETAEGARITADTNIVLFEPRDFNDAEEIGFHIKTKKACCVNLHRMPGEHRQRIIDFLSGVVFGVDGTIKKIGPDVILCSPKNLVVGGDIKLGPEAE